jgi:hypothetical protein
VKPQVVTKKPGYNARLALNWALKDRSFVHKNVSKKTGMCIRVSTRKKQ